MTGKTPLECGWRGQSERLLGGDRQLTADQAKLSSWLHPTRLNSKVSQTTIFDRKNAFIKVFLQKNIYFESIGPMEILFYFENLYFMVL